MDITAILAAIFAGFIYGITPGPGVLAALGIGVGRGRSPAFKFLAGHFLGDVVWSSLALVSIAGVAAIDSVVFEILGLVSGLYLCWLGIRSIRYKSDTRQVAEQPQMRNPLLHGVLFGLTNPKAYPVAIATLTALLSDKLFGIGWSSMPILMFATALGGLIAYLILLLVVGTKQIMMPYQCHQPTIVRLSGVLFLGFGVHALAHSVPGLFGSRSD